jgi:Fe-S oxidoreductase
MNVMALALLDGRISVDRDLAQIVSACTTCGLCDVSCKFIMAAERQDVIIALKEHLVESGLSPTPKTQIQTTLPHWADGMNLKTLPDSKADVLLFVGAEPGTISNMLQPPVNWRNCSSKRESILEFSRMSRRAESNPIGWGNASCSASRLEGRWVRWIMPE